MACCSKHKEKCTGNDQPKKDSIEPNSSDTTDQYEFPTEDTVPIKKLEQLRYNEDVKNCLKNPQVRDIITSALKDKNPTKAIAKAMSEPVFVDLADACLKIVEPSDEQKPC